METSASSIEWVSAKFDIHQDSRGPSKLGFGGDKTAENDHPEFFLRNVDHERGRPPPATITGESPIDLRV